MTTTESRRIRIQFDFSEDALQHLEELTHVVDASTRAEVIRNALWAYEWLVQKALQDKDLKISAEDLRVITKVRLKTQKAETT